jgi:WD40 repeat protein
MVTSVCFAGNESAEDEQNDGGGGGGGGADRGKAKARRWRVVSGSADCTVRVWSLRLLQPAVPSEGWAPGGQSGAAVAWRWMPLKTLNAHTAMVNGVAALPLAWGNGRSSLLASVSDDCSVGRARARTAAAVAARAHC